MQQPASDFSVGTPMEQIGRRLCRGAIILSQPIFSSPAFYPSFEFLKNIAHFQYFPKPKYDAVS